MSWYLPVTYQGKNYFNNFLKTCFPSTFWKTKQVLNQSKVWKFSSIVKKQAENMFLIHSYVKAWFLFLILISTTSITDRPVSRGVKIPGSSLFQSLTILTTFNSSKLKFSSLKINLFKISWKHLKKCITHYKEWDWQEKTIALPH